ncbi:MAG: hypothetical protein Q8941_22745 [Bacteroidota bacterium]|nr:hypothetical protein [Bacteroidota bacterium]
MNQDANTNKKSRNFRYREFFLITKPAVAKAMAGEVAQTRDTSNHYLEDLVKISEL